MKATHSKKVDDTIWKIYLKEMNSIEEDIKKINHPMIKKSVKESLHDSLIVKFTEELENKMIRDELC